MVSNKPKRRLDCRLCRWPGTGHRATGLGVCVCVFYSGGLLSFYFLLLWPFKRRPLSRRLRVSEKENIVSRGRPHTAPLLSFFLSFFRFSLTFSIISFIVILDCGVDGGGRCKSHWE